MYDPYFSYASESLLYIAVLVVAVIGMIASLKVQSTFKKYSTMLARCGLRANDVARRLLYEGGSSATLSPVSGSLTDHYDPTKNAVGLSESVYNSTSVAALAVAAHEIGHVMQHQEGYTPIKVRNALLPVARIGSTVGPWLVIIGIMMGAFNLASIGAGLYFGILAFQLVTLPVEFDATARAKKLMVSAGIVSPDEERGAGEVLNAAFLTYVASAVTALLTLLYYLWRAGVFNRRD